MARHLPPLNSLRAFEAAARHMSFTRAAEELYVTQGAVSRQVKTLEEYLDVQLFQRLNRSLLIAEEGQIYMGAIGKAFDIIDNATSRLQKLSDEGLLTIRLLPTFALRWLIPRLHEFQEVYPRIEVRITTSLRPGDYTREDVDIIVGRRPDKRANLRFDHIMDENLVAVCSPSLLSGDIPLGVPADLKNHTLLHAMTRENAWGVWLQAIGEEDIDPDKGLRFEHYYFTLQAAVEGLGVAMAPGPLVEDDLASKRLVAPFDVIVSSDDAYYLMYPESRAELPKVRYFREWVLSVVGKLPSTLARISQTTGCIGAEKLG